MRKCAVISRVKEIVDHDLKEVRAYGNLYSSVTGFLRVLDKRKTFSDSTYNFMKENINQLQHYVECEECQSHFKQFVHQLSECTNEYNTDEMNDIHSRLNTHRCVSDK